MAIDCDHIGKIKNEKRAELYAQYQKTKKANGKKFKQEYERIQQNYLKETREIDHSKLSSDARTARIKAANDRYFKALFKNNDWLDKVNRQAALDFDKAYKKMSDELDQACKKQREEERERKKREQEKEKEKERKVTEKRNKLSKVISHHFTGLSNKQVSEMINDIFTYGKQLNLERDIEIAHFLGQMKEEVGNGHLEESLNYAADKLQIFTYYQKHEQEAQQDGRTKNHPANPQNIANKAYGNRMGNGAPETGEGWKYRGRGYFQITGKKNYAKTTKTYNKVFSDNVDFVKNPELLTKSPYSIRSAMVYWYYSRMGVPASWGIDSAHCNEVTNIINEGIGAKSRQNRVRYTQRIAEEIKAMGGIF